MHTGFIEKNQSYTLVEVILPLAIPSYYTYLVPFDFIPQLAIGKRAVVPFRGTKMYTGIIVEIHHNMPSSYRPKWIEDIIDDTPIIHSWQLDFWQWMARYYMCYIGEVMQAALPSVFKLSSQTEFYFNSSVDYTLLDIDDDTYLIADALSVRQKIQLLDIQKILNRKNIYPVVRQLLFHQIGIRRDVLKDKYRQRYEYIVSSKIDVHNPVILKQAFEKLKRAPKQEVLFTAWITLSKSSKIVTKTRLIDKAKVSTSILKQLERKGLLELTKKYISRLDIDIDRKESASQQKLTENQQQAKHILEEALSKKKIALLQGITGSGKTHIYMHFIREAIDKGQQVLYLLPEIALTIQIIHRLKCEFGNQIAVYHSKYNNQARGDTWKGVKTGVCKLIVGARSAIFLPFFNLGLIVVDEEHDRSYKQQNPNPRYQARDTAIVLAHQLNARVLLGSATPSLETLYNVNTGKYGIARLLRRFNNVQLPKTIIIDVKKEKKETPYFIFSSLLIHKIEEVIRHKKQIILFYNRRGFALYAECNTCAWVPMCTICDVSLVYHKHIDSFICHYCGTRHNKIHKCKACGDSDIRIRGIGTQKIEEFIQSFLPYARVDRMDWDTTKKKDGHTRIIQKFEDGKIDILVGTQMVSKGLDFKKVQLVAILDAQQLFTSPDFRSSERAYQMLKQISGRSGRSAEQGEVVIQTTDPKNKILQYLLNEKLDDFYEKELLHRQQFRYTPFVRLIGIYVRHRDFNVTNHAAHFLFNLIELDKQVQVLGPSQPWVVRVKNKYILQLLIKTHKNSKILKNVKQNIAKCVRQLKQNKSYKQVLVSIDVDPY